MNCPYIEICGGCPLRNLTETEYQQTKKVWFDKVLTALNQPEIAQDKPVFIADGSRRRAELTFEYSHKKLSLGFNAAQSHKIADIEYCLALTENLNNLLLQVHRFLEDLCQINITKKIKNKIITANINQGEIWLTEADNGIDILLEINDSLNLEQRMLISEWAAENPKVIRLSVRVNNGKPETIIEKLKPYINIAEYQVYIAAGTFLQPSKAGEQALISLVLQYAGKTTGKIADLFCGIGTFSYPLSANMQNKITAVDSSAELLAGFKQTINANMIPNIEILQKNLFKYPLDADELKQFALVVFDPPRAGAAAQVKQFTQMFDVDKPQKIIAVSCNPHTFINDANTLLSGGYTLEKITMVDQFVYSKHCELVALFIKKGENNGIK
ncbi:MAG: class I SAM-dependent RNA methyltransferase [Alphaproteobacteria bacterium]|nr:class I SAM-dependent RNA methyltransferase [Alphaproteobacteria bacterium]